MAGSLKRENPFIIENLVLIRALRDSNLPKFLKDDAILFQVHHSAVYSIIYGMKFNNNVFLIFRGY